MRRRGKASMREGTEEEERREG
jgi:hypothetical protein